MRFLFSFLCCLLTCAAWGQRVGGQMQMGGRFQMGYSAASGGGGANIVADFWQTFEFATLTTGNLDANDNIGTGTWTITDAGSSLSISTSGSQHTTSTVNGTADTGTRGMAINCTAAATARIEYDSATTHSDLTMSCWYFTPTIGNFDSDEFMGILGGSSHYASFGQGGGTTTRYIQWLAAGSGTITVTAGQWYWVTMQLSQAGTCSLSVYNASGTQVGSTITKAATGIAMDQFVWGAILAPSASGASPTAYLDNCVIDWTHNTFPLGP